jgi:hypothetical protein
LAFLCLAAPCHAGDNSTVEENAAAGKFDQGKQGDALGGLERTGGKTINDVNVPSASAPQPVDTSSATTSVKSIPNSLVHSASLRAAKRRGNPYGFSAIAKRDGSPRPDKS